MLAETVPSSRVGRERRESPRIQPQGLVAACCSWGSFSLEISRKELVEAAPGRQGICF